MSNEITGIVKAKLDAVQRGTIIVQTVAIELAGNGQWPEVAVVEFAGKSYQKLKDKLDQLQVGQTVEVGFNYSGREWNGKWFNTLAAWKIFIKDGYQQAPTQQQAPAAQAQNQPTQDNGDEEPPF